MRFLFNFFFFGLLFYAIWFFFPEAFSTLLHGAQTVFNYIKEMFGALMDKINPSKTPTSAPEANPAFLLFYAALRPKTTRK
jgi:hypothetical protein